ncbi:MAG: LysM peptidoglycan-binding domain-containing protein [Syntrophobacteria bacterium]
MNRYAKAFILSALLVGFSVGAFSPGGEVPAAVVREDTAYLDFVRTETIRTFKDEQVVCENYIVKKGDYVWRILRRRGHDSPAQLAHWSWVLKTFNPELRDIDRIYPGQRLVVPLGFVAQEEAGKHTPLVSRNTTTHEVQSGDTVCGILRQRFQLSDKEIFTEALARVKRLNPEIRDLDRIEPGQRLILPLYKMIDGKEKTVSASAAGVEPHAAPADHGATPTEAVLAGRSPEGTSVGAPVEQEGPETYLKTRLAARLSPEEQRVQVLADAFMALVVALGGECQASGRHFLPLKGGGQITLKARSFPLLEFPTGERILLDINDRLSPSLEEVIKANYQGRYAVVNVSNSDNFRSVWQRCMEHLPAMKQWLDREPLLIREPLEVAIRGDWVLTFSSSPSQQQRRVVVINLVASDRARTDPAIQAYLETLGVRVIDVQLRGQLERPRIFAPLDEKAFEPRPKALCAETYTALEAATAFLELLCQPYQRDARVPLYTGNQKEVTVTVKAGLYFQREGKAYVIDFRSLSLPIVRLLENRHLEVVVMNPCWKSAQVFRALMECLELTVEDSYGFFASKRDSTRNIYVTIPGDLIRGQEQCYLIAAMDVPPSLADFLARENVRVLSY